MVDTAQDPVKTNDRGPADPWSRLGASDLGFKDTQLQSSYNYTALPPFALHGIPAFNASGAASLRDAAAKKLAKVICTAQNVPELISAAPTWGVWQKVWKWVLYSEQDSPEVFRLFFDAFGKQPQFRCHFFPRASSHWSADHNSDRASFVLVNSLSRRHRFETLYQNISLHSLVHDLNMFARFDPVNIVVLNMAGIDVSQGYHQLMALRNLTLLNLTNSSVSPEMLNSLAMGIKSGGKLRRLRALLLGKNGLEQFPSYFPVDYIELDKSSCTPTGYKQVDNLRFLHMPDSQKLKELVALGYLKGLNLKEPLVLDYRLLAENFPGLQELSATELEDLWVTRRKVPKIRVHSFVRTGEMPNPKIPRARQPQAGPVRKKPRIAQASIDINKFFDM